MNRPNKTGALVSNLEMPLTDIVGGGVNTRCSRQGIPPSEARSLTLKERDSGDEADREGRNIRRREEANSAAPRRKKLRISGGGTWDTAARRGCVLAVVSNLLVTLVFCNCEFSFRVEVDDV